MVRPLAIAALLLSHLACAEAPKPALAPQYYTLALSWHPTFCQRFPKSDECAADRSTLVFHGYWPERRKDIGHDFAFCGVGEDVKLKDKTGWDKLDEVPPADKYDTAKLADVLATIGEVMPGKMSGLDRHEWWRHGTCSGLSAADYFATANDVARRFLDSSFKSWLTDTVSGQTVTTSQVVAEFEKTFGEGSGKSLRLDCFTLQREGAQEPSLKEVRVFLAPPRKDQGGLEWSQGEDYQDSTCPGQFFVPPVR